MDIIFNFLIEKCGPDDIRVILSGIALLLNKYNAVCDIFCTINESHIDIGVKLLCWYWCLEKKLNLLNHFPEEFYQHISLLDECAVKVNTGQTTNKYLAIY